MTIALIRTVILYIVIIISVRIMGRRQVGELQPSELAITMLISNLAALPMEDRDLPLITGVIPILALVSFEVFTSYIIKSFPSIRKKVCGSPKILIKDGVINQKNLKELRFSVDDLIEELRLKDVFDFKEVDCAIAETTGEVSVFKKYAYQTVQNNDLNLKKDSYPPFLVIENGNIDNDGLLHCKKTKGFIMQKIKEENIDIKNIFVMMCDERGKYTIIKKEKT